MLSAEEVLPNAEPLLEGVIPSTEWVTVASFYSTRGGVPLPTGTLVQAFDQAGTLAGQAQVGPVPGRFAMAVYRDDPATAVDEGLDPGERITFLVEGQPVYVLGPEAPVWTDMGDLLILNLSDRGWVYLPVLTRTR
jgi:hypothetical protein